MTQSRPPLPSLALTSCRPAPLPSPLPLSPAQADRRRCQLDVLRFVAARDELKAAKQAELYASGGWVGSVAAWRQRQQHALLSASNLQQYSACA